MTEATEKTDAERRDEGTAKARDAERRDEGTAKARDAELKRQADVVAAVAKANDDELPKLGGPIRNPGLGR